MSGIVRSTALAVAVSLVSFAAASPLFAQDNQNNQNHPPKAKKTPNQVPETGEDDPAADAGASLFERVPENLPVTVRADGTVMIQLDESYMEASTVTLGADGELTFAHYTGLARASQAAALLPARPLPLLFPILEEKE